jgi:hypothetical protein
MGGETRLSISSSISVQSVLKKGENYGFGSD